MTAAPHSQHRRRRCHHEDGYTLLELLVVLAILGLLAGIGTPMVMKHLEQARLDTAKLQIDGFAAGLDLFRLDTGRYPSREEGLVALIERPKGAERWRGPYIKNSTALNDPWGHPYHYRPLEDDGDIELYSSGPKSGPPVGRVDAHASR